MRKREMKILGVKVDFYSQLALFCLLLIVLTGLLSNLIANSKPIYIKNNGNTYFPVFEKKKTYDFSSELLGKRTYQLENINWTEVPESKKIFALIPFDPGKSDRN